MKSAFQALAVASAMTVVAAQGNTPIIQSPASLVVCQPALLSFSGGTAPYFISVLPGGQPSAAALEQFPQQSGNSYTWNVNIAAGQSITLSIRDSTGSINYSSELPIQSGTDTSCIGQSLTGSGSSTPGGAATSGASNSAGSSSQTSSGSSSSPTSMSSSSSSSSSGVAQTVSSGASSVASQVSSGASSVVGQASSAVAGITSAVTGAASTKYIANIAGVAGVAAIVVLFA